MAGFAAGTGPLAHHFHALCTLDPVGYLGSCVPNGQCRPGLRRSHDRQHRDSRPPACRWRPKKRGPQALGRSCSGFGTQIHGLVDALGNPIGFTLTGAEQADISQAPALLDQAPSAGAVIADKGYDANAWVERLNRSRSRRSSTLDPTARVPATMIDIVTRLAISSNASSIRSSNSVASPHATKNRLHTSPQWSSAAASCCG